MFSSTNPKKCEVVTSFSTLWVTRIVQETKRTRPVRWSIGVEDRVTGRVIVSNYAVVYPPFFKTTPRDKPEHVV